MTRDDAAGEAPVLAVPVADTLGAGDVFPGALTARIAAHGVDGHGFYGARLEADLAFGAQVAAVSVRSFGTRAWLDATAPPAP